MAATNSQPIPARHDPVRSAYDLREQLASGKRKTALLFGAGSSISAKIPGLDQLTNIVGTTLSEPFKGQYKKLLDGMSKQATLEDVLNRTRLIRELLDGSSSTFEGLTSAAAEQLDIAICRVIYDKVAAPPLTELRAHISLATWLHYVQRESPVELFTTNYDLLFEMTLESVGVPYFDGFVGAVSPFFVPESVDAELGKNSEDVYPPRSWIRVWKLHGSVGWQLVSENVPEPNRICRATGPCAPPSDAQLLIYPSREKYVESRRLPFVVYMDRLRRLLQSGECLLLVNGYSFRDDHVNELLTQGLRANPRLAITVLLYGPPTDYLISLAHSHKNLSFFSPKSASIGGVHGTWLPTRKKMPGEEWPFWDEGKNEFTLGDFVRFGQFLDLMTGLLTQPAAPTLSTVTPGGSAGGTP